MPLAVHNIIMGSMYLELQGKQLGFNESTGDKIEVIFKPKTWRKPE